MKCKKGFTLVEVLVATALLAIVAVGFLGALTLSSRVLLRADTRETARDLAQGQMEYIQNQHFVALTDNSIVMVGATLTAEAPAGSTSLSLASTANLPAEGAITIGTGSLAETLSYTVEDAVTIGVPAMANMHYRGEPVFTRYYPAQITAGQSHYAVTVLAQSPTDAEIQDITVTVFGDNGSVFTLSGKKVKWGID